MKLIERKRDHYGQMVIYVGECDRYKYENPSIPKKSILDLHNLEERRIYDIIYAVEDYFYDSGE